MAASRLETEAALRRSRIAAEVEADRYAYENVLRRSRVEAELASERVANEAALRRSRIEAEIATESVLPRRSHELRLRSRPADIEDCITLTFDDISSHLY